MNIPIYCSLKRVMFFIILIAIVSGKANSQWTLQQTSTQFPLRSIYFVNNNTGFVVSNSNNVSSIIGGEIFRTTDGGNNWQMVLLDSNFRGKGFYFSDENTGFVVGGRFVEEGFIYKTTNSGINWINISQPQINSGLYNIVFTSSITGYTGGFDGVFKTTDSGNNWARVLQVITTFYSLGNRIYFINDNIGFYIRDSASVYKTTNAGLNWQYTLLQNNPYGSYLRDIKFLDTQTGYIIGENGLIQKTTNQGINWNVFSSGTSHHLYALFFPNFNTGYISGEHIILKSTNSGVNWFSVLNSEIDTLFSEYFTSPDTGYVCGSQGRVYKTTTGGVLGIMQVDPSVPVSYNLQQNYPNPFNPSTKIKFDIPKVSNVNLSVYDALGRELETLVNESLQPGTYEVSWQAEKLASGIYFYKLLANDFSMVKKMSLIK